uniref:NADH-ubiquinone oxidoreductase chain 6 n=1 Tax=Craspedacusta sowerbii TaxID=128124 RepID=A0A8F6YG19_CRASO|nr:NADH dehydrogenase subunit 6 [Craspedacusta sowerbii]
MEQLFLIFSTLILVAGVMVVLSINPIHSVFWLTLTFILTAMLFITLNIDFVALMLVIVYVGAIAILFLFVIMMLDVLRFRESLEISQLIPATLLIGMGFFINLWWLNQEQLFKLPDLAPFQEWDFVHDTNIELIARIMYTDLWIPFLLASIILLVAMIGAIVLTHELGRETKKQSLYRQHQRNDSWI